MSIHKLASAVLSSGLSIMASLHFASALLPTGWADDVQIVVSDGTITSVTEGVPPTSDDEQHEVAIPGIASLHSHAFQRGMAGLAEISGHSTDTFWTWRETMYRFALSMRPEDVEAVATLLYIEMLERGFTRVGEFHYLHHDRDGTPYADVAEMAVRIAAAAQTSGIGLTLQEIKRLFRPFSQANVTIASRFGGAGLGLSSVRQLARAMGGDVVVTPHEGGGTTFTLTVTLLVAAAPHTTMGEGEDGVTLAPARPLRILGVEDNPFGRVVLNTILNELGHQAEFIGRGEAAPERIAAGSYDAVLMDMVLPGINGIETVARIRALGAPHGDIPIIGVSGRGEDEAASRAAGADAFLLKPVSPRALATALLEVTHRAAAAT